MGKQSSKLVSDTGCDAHFAKQKQAMLGLWSVSGKGHFITKSGSRVDLVDGLMQFLHNNIDFDLEGGTQWSWKVIGNVLLPAFKAAFEHKQEEVLVLLMKWTKYVQVDENSWWTAEQIYRQALETAKEHGDFSFIETITEVEDLRQWLYRNCLVGEKAVVPGRERFHFDYEMQPDDFIAMYCAKKHESAKNRNKR